MTLTLLHTNDIHGHLTGWDGWEGELEGRRVGGLDRLASAVRAVRDERPGQVLLLDAGDLLGDTMIADLTKGKAPLSVLNHLGYDAMTVGNHEPDFGADVLRERIAEAKFPVVAANLAWNGGGPSPTPPFAIREAGGARVGILGVAYPKTAWTSGAKNVEGLEFREPAAAVRDALARMRREGAELAVVLSHLGLAGDEHLARSVAGIDVIVGGHSHNRMRAALRVGGTLIVQAGAHGSDLGRLDLTVEGGEVTSHRATLVTLDHAEVPSDPATARLIDELLRPHRQALDAVIGHADGWLVRAQTLAGQEARMRDEESPIDSLFADILRERTRTDVALLPGVGYGVAIPPGSITAAQLRQMVPHDGKVVTMRLPAARIVEVLEQAVENVYSDDPAAKVGGMVQVSGLRFDYDPSLARGHRVTRVERIGGRWDPVGDYAVATNSMLAKGGHRQGSFAHGAGSVEGPSQYEMIREWFTAHAAVATPPPGRIREVEERS